MSIGSIIRTEGDFPLATEAFARARRRPIIMPRHHMRRPNVNEWWEDMEFKCITWPLLIGGVIIQSSESKYYIKSSDSGGSEYAMIKRILWDCTTTALHTQVQPIWRIAWLYTQCLMASASYRFSPKMLHPASERFAEHELKFQLCSAVPYFRAFSVVLQVKLHTRSNLQLDGFWLHPSGLPCGLINPQSSCKANEFWL